MPNLIMMLIDDHIRVKKMFRGFGRYSGDLPLARTICYELTMHSVIEEELLYPLLRDRVDPRLAEEAEADHAEVKMLMEKINKMEPDDPTLKTVVHRMKLDVERHNLHEERDLFPAIEHLRDDLFDAGRKMYARTQELITGKELPREVKSLMVANAGW